MPSRKTIDRNLEKILEKYRKSFLNKEFNKDNIDIDLIMDLFSITSVEKQINKQYWGRELGYCWQLIVTEIAKKSIYYKPPLKIGMDEPCDLIFKKYAIDTKYRIGSGDSGTLKKFKTYGKLLRQKGYVPVFLIVRNDNLASAITACKVGKWELYFGKESYDFIKQNMNYDIENFLKSHQGSFSVKKFS